MNRVAAAMAFLCCIVLCALLAACAAPGEPVPPHPVLPAPIADLAARQSGSEMVLSFSVPRTAVDGDALIGAPAVEIYRDALPASKPADRKIPWRLVYIIPAERVDDYEVGGHFEFRDLLPDELLRDTTGASAEYMVRSRVDRRRASADSNVAPARIFPAPAAPANLEVALTESAIELSWGPEVPAGTAAARYRVYRTLEETSAPDSPPGQPSEKLKARAELIGSPSEPRFSDRSFEMGRTYLYVVRRVAQFGGDEVESADSPAKRIAARDIFPPQAPAGLQLVVGAGESAPGTGSQSSQPVELSWGISPEADVAGYYVYRSEREESPGERISAELLPSPTFRDISSARGRRYWYRVSAVDRAGNESPLSAAVHTE